MKKTMRWITTLAWLLFLAALLWQCVDLYRSGMGFRPEEILLRLGRLKPFVLVCLALLPAGLLAERKASPQELLPAKRYRGTSRPPEHSATVKALPVWLLALAGMLTVLGVGNGGMRDVWVKAINICTECIGLG